MKTTKFYTVLSLVVIFAAFTSAYAGGIGKTKIVPVETGGIRYQVNVILSIEKPLCNAYLIEVRNGKSQLVAPAQRYMMGVTKYTFTERGPAEGERVASLVRDNRGDHFICEYELFTTPVSLKGHFEIGQTYRFDLYPSLETIKN
jgi:hypothetical protein